MYNYKLLDGEEVILISDNSLLKKDNDNLNISTILTNKRLILLDYPNPVNNYEEVLRTSRNMDCIKQKEELYSVSLEQIKTIYQEDNYDKYILNNGDYFFLNDKDIKEKIIEYIK